MKKVHKGQVALVMVLIMTVVSALAVSLASRSTVETRVQQMNVENTEAVLTAQAGLEAAIAENAPVSGSVSEGKSYNVTVGDTGSSSITTDKVNSGETFEVYLEGSVGVTGVNIYWKPVNAGETPAIFITDIRSTQNVDYAYDSNGTGGFTQVSSGGSFQGVAYDYKIPSPINVTAESQRLRITVLGAAAQLGVEPVGGVFPPQQTDFKSVADLAGQQTTVKYGIEYLESKTDQLPSVFDYVLFSGGTIE